MEVHGPQQPRKKGKTALYVTSALMLGILAYFYFGGRPPIPPLDGFVPLSIPINDSTPIGKIFEDGELKGVGTNNFKIYRSYDSIRSISGYSNIAELKLAIMKKLNSSLKIRRKDIEITSIDSLVIYKVDDYSTLSLPNEGALVVSAAIVVKKLYLSSTKSSGANINLDSAKTLFDDASLSTDNQDSSLKFGKGLVSFVKLIQVRKDTSIVHRTSWTGEKSEVTDLYFHSNDFLAFSTPTGDDTKNYKAAHVFNSACLKITLTVSGLDYKNGSILFSPRKDQVNIKGVPADFLKGPVSDYYSQIDELSCRAPVSILNSMDAKRIYKYRIMVDSANFRLGPERLENLRGNPWRLYPIDTTRGGLRLFLDIWTYSGK